MSPRPIPAALEREPRVELGDTGRDLYAATPGVSYADAENDWAWANYCGALSYLLDEIAAMVRDDADGNPGWTSLASPTRCPTAWLRVLAQWAGVHRWDSLSEDDLRALIGPRAPGMWRGTKAAMIDAVARHFPPGTAASAIYFEERADGDPYQLRVFTYEFVEHDPVVVERDLRAAKPAGLNLIYERRVGQTWAMLNERKASWDQVRTDYANWWEVLHDLPPGVELPPPEPGPPTLGDIEPVNLGPGDPMTLTGTDFDAGNAQVRFLRESTLEEWFATGVVVVDAATITASCPDMGPDDLWPVVSVVTDLGESAALPVNYSTLNLEEGAP